MPNTSPIEKLLIMLWRVSERAREPPVDMNCSNARLMIMTKTSLNVESREIIVLTSSELASLSIRGIVATLLTPPSIVPSSRDSIRGNSKSLYAEKDINIEEDMKYVAESAMAFHTFFNTSNRFKLRPLSKSTTSKATLESIESRDSNVLGDIIPNTGPIKIPANTSITDSGMPRFSNRYVAIKPVKIIRETSMKTSI